MAKKSAQSKSAQRLDKQLTSLLHQLEEETVDIMKPAGFEHIATLQEDELEALFEIDGRKFLLTRVGEVLFLYGEKPNEK